VGWSATPFKGECSILPIAHNLRAGVLLPKKLHPGPRFQGSEREGEETGAEPSASLQKGWFGGAGREHLRVGFRSERRI
jgi:hypothetical protein